MIRLLLIAPVCMFVISCSQSTDCYSCDSDVDAFVKRNEEPLRGMAVTELATYNPEAQRAAFRMYDAHKRQMVWEEKYDHILTKNPNGYSNGELSAIRELSDYVTEKGIEQTEKFLHQPLDRANARGFPLER